jgi:hypothetical protein
MHGLRPVVTKTAISRGEDGSLEMSDANEDLDDCKSQEQKEWRPDKSLQLPSFPPLHSLHRAIASIAVVTEALAQWISN